jgi:acetyl-CoA synthetase
MQSPNPMPEINQNPFESISQESRVFPPHPSFSGKARVPSMENYRETYEKSLADPEAYWAEIASELHWFEPWKRVFNADQKPFFRWFEGGKTNIAYNCVDRQIELGHGNKAALIWEGEPGESDVRVLTYRDLYREVNRFANALRKLGLKKGDRAAIYLPMIPELAIATLACARIGVIHTVIFAGFSPNSIRDRILDCGAKLVITADGGWRRGQILNLKSIVDEALVECPDVSDVVIVKRGHGDPFPCKVKEGRDKWYHRIIQDQPIHCEAEPMDAEDLLFLLYTSGTTGKPKGIIHTTGGYMTYAYHTMQVVFDIRPDDVYWCSADIGWVTGHSYILYGPLLNGTTVLLYEGAPNWPDAGRFWELIEKYRVSVFYTAPTAIRAFMKWGENWPMQRDLSSLRLLGSVGEPINPEAWIWYHEVIGSKRCPIVDTWWQTETGGILISPLPGATPTKPGSATLPLFGIEADVLDEEGNPVSAGLLAIKGCWPGIMRGIWGDPDRYRETYWSKWKGEYYFPGDGARKDSDGYFWILGRVDDVVNVSGHRIGTAELESIFVGHSNVVEAAVIGTPHPIKGQCLVAFVTLKAHVQANERTIEELNQLVIQEIGKFALPERIIFGTDLPKTRSGKIMRRLLRDITEGRAMGNLTTLADPSVVEALKQRYLEN